MFKRLKNKRGFTLMEIVIALALFSVLVAAITPVFIKFNTDIAESKQFEIQKSVIISAFEADKKGIIQRFKAGHEVILGEDGIKVKLIEINEFDKEIKIGNDKAVIPGVICIFQKTVGTKLKVQIFVSEIELLDMGIVI